MIYLFRRNCFFDADIISYSFTLQLIHILWSASQSSHICPLSSPASKILEAKISLIFHQFSLCIFTNFHSAFSPIFTLQLIHILWSSHICPLSSPAYKILEAPPFSPKYPSSFTNFLETSKKELLWEALEKYSWSQLRDTKVEVIWTFAARRKRQRRNWALKYMSILS